MASIHRQSSPSLAELMQRTIKTGASTQNCGESLLPKQKNIGLFYEEREFTPFVFTVAFCWFFPCKKKTLGTQHFKWTTWWHCWPIAMRLIPDRAWMFAWKSALAVNLYTRKDVFVASRTFVAQKQKAATKGSFVFYRQCWKWQLYP